MNICVCVGSSCHLKGAYQVVKRFQELAGEASVTWDICADFCNERCTEGVIVSIDGVVYTQVSPDGVEKILTRHRLGGVPIE